MAELVDASDLKSLDASHVGSIPTGATILFRAETLAKHPSPLRLRPATGFFSNYLFIVLKNFYRRELHMLCMTRTKVHLD